MRNWLELAQRRSTPEPNTGCWLWLGAVTARGRASVGDGADRTDMLTRKLLGLVPGDKKIACHRCDQAGCVNPDHLYVGTQLDNAQDYRTRQKPAGWGDTKSCPHCGGPVERKVYGSKRDHMIYRCKACCSRRYRAWLSRTGPRKKRQADGQGVG